MIRLTSKEQKALLLLIVILAAGTLAQLLLPHSIKSSQYDYTLQDSLFKALSADTLTENPKVVRETKPVPVPKKTEKHSTKRTVKKARKALKQKSVEINSAGLQELQALPGIGPKTAQRIVDYRNEHGPFKTLEMLTKVKRIGPKTLQKIRPYIFIKSAQTDSGTSK